MQGLTKDKGIGANPDSNKKYFVRKEEILMINMAVHRFGRLLNVIVFVFIIIATLFMFTSIVKAADDREVVSGKYAVVVQDNYGSEVCVTDTETVGDLFKEKGITLGKKDILNCELSDSLSGGMVINIKRAENVTFLIDGNERYTIYMNVYTVGEALSLLREETEVNYTLGKGLSSSQPYDVVDEIPVVSVYKKVETRVVDYPYETETIENPELEEGVTNVISEGVDGKKQLTLRVKYEGGVEKDYDVIDEAVIKAPINKVVEVGTKKNEPEPFVPVMSFTGSESVVRQLTMNSSAYSIDYACTGKSPGMPGYGITASGIRAGYGIVAVDPSVIPLGTKLYVEGYGYALAADTGGAIKGNKIDLCFNSYNEAVNYGRKNVQVYVLS